MAPRPTDNVRLQYQTDIWFVGQVVVVIWLIGSLLGYVIAGQVFTFIVSPTPQICQITPPPKPQAPTTQPSVFGTEGAASNGDIYSDGWGDFDKITE